MVAAKGETEVAGDRLIQRRHEIEGQEDLALDRRAVERRPRAEGGGRRGLGRAARALAILHERSEFRDGRP